MQTCKHANILFFCKKILGQDLKSGHLLEIEKKENMQKHFSAFLQSSNSAKLSVDYSSSSKSISPTLPFFTHL